MTTINDTLMEETLEKVNSLDEKIKEINDTVEKMNAEIIILKEKASEDLLDKRNMIQYHLNQIECKRNNTLENISKIKKRTVPEGYIQLTAYGFFGERVITDDFAVKLESEESIRQEEYRGLNIEFIQKYPDIYVWKKLYWIPISDVKDDIIEWEKIGGKVD